MRGPDLSGWLVAKILGLAILSSWSGSVAAQGRRPEKTFGLQAYLWAQGRAETDFFDQGRAGFRPQWFWKREWGDASSWAAMASFEACYQGRAHPNHGFLQAGLHRLWARYGSARGEVRLGIQELNFGSAMILRPLQWFEPDRLMAELESQAGLWALSAKHYLANNASLWGWSLYRSKQVDLWTKQRSVRDRPEFGARWQVPLSRGEIALSYHGRWAEYLSENSAPVATPENRAGFDLKVDLGPGLWLEGMWLEASQPAYHIKTICWGADYTVKLGNGLGLLCEHLWIQDSRGRGGYTAGQWKYPLSLADDIEGNWLWCWERSQSALFFAWRHSHGSWSLAAMFLKGREPLSGGQDCGPWRWRLLVEFQY